MATYNQPFLKLTFGGTQAQGQDEWNCGINLGIYNDALIPIGDPDATRAFDLYKEEIDDDIVELISDYFSAPVMDVPNQATLDYIKLAVIGRDGKYMEDSHIWDVADTTGASTRQYVPQVSLVMTLQSNKRSDPGKFGRFYLPTTAPVTPATYRPSNTEGKANLTAQLISDLNRNMSPLFQAVRVTPAAVTSGEKFEGNYQPFTRVKVGNVYDTQRRRRNRIAETYVEALVSDPLPVEAE